ncbi:IclR family transcriptional regulator [Amorphus suaedae]
MSETTSSLAPVRGRPRATRSEPEGIVALEVGLDILRAVYEGGGSVSLSDLSRISGEKPNKLHRYLVSLRERGYLVQSEETGHYDLGPESHRLGMAALRRYDPIIGVRNALANIRNATGNQIHLYVWTPVGPTLVASEQGTHYFPFTVKLGSALPLLSSATGRVFLAFMPRAKCERLLREEIRVNEVEGIKIDMEAIEAELATIRASEIYWSTQAIVSSTAAMMPLFDESGELACCVTSIIPRGIRRPEVEQAVTKAFLSARERLPLHGPPG